MIHELRYTAKMYFAFELWFRDKDAILPSRINEVLLGEIDRLFDFYALKETYKLNEKYEKFTTIIKN